jgi:HSP20 family protein
MNENKSVAKYTNPFTLLNRDEVMTPWDSWFDGFFTSRFPELSSELGVNFFEKGSYPKVDVVEFEDRVEVDAEIPGLDKKDIRVEVDGDCLVIAGNKVEKTETKGKFLRRELKRSSFHRTFNVGNNLDKDSVEAKFNNGLLKVIVKKTTPTPSKLKQIEIK